jgi:hypothetical protein
VSLLGIEGARREAASAARRAVQHLTRAGMPTTSLGPLAQYIVKRDS